MGRPQRSTGGASQAEEKMSIVAILHNIRSLHNVGSIFRTADAAGVEKLFLTGYTPAPVDAFGKVRSEIAKTALGAEESVAWEKYLSVAKVIQKLKQSGFYIVALEQSDRAVDYRKFKPHKPIALIVGNEVRGLSSSVLKKCDVIIEMPMRGKKESLNVAVAFGVAVFSLKRDQNAPYIPPPSFSSAA